MSADNWANCPKCKGEETVREDYWQGIITDGTRYDVDYQAACVECSFSLEYHHSIDLTGDADVRNAKPDRDGTGDAG